MRHRTLLVLQQLWMAEIGTLKLHLGMLTD